MSFRWLLAFFSTIISFKLEGFLFQYNPYYRFASFIFQVYLLCQPWWQEELSWLEFLGCFIDESVEIQFFLMLSRAVSLVFD
jgi:hypothetical protein